MEKFQVKYRMIIINGQWSIEFGYCIKSETMKSK